jgi:iron(III) transport system ATP-binding protein
MLRVTGLSKSFAPADGPVRAVDDVSFEIADAQCYALLGPSGCGKTTALRCVAGLEQPEHGRIEIAGRVVSDAAAGIFVPVHERSIGMVFQSYAIWPHLDVFENVAYPLRVQRPRLRKDEIVRRVTEVLTIVGMDALASRPAPRLSGGQQQRVALARAVVRSPSLLLLDEPLSNLDARLREAMRRELAALIKRIDITALFVTHDQVEALSLAQRVAVMSNGRIVQEGAPAEVYGDPKDLFVARFLGATNVIGGRVEASAADGKMRIGLDCNGKTLILGGAHRPGDVVDVVLRPENLTLTTESPSDQINAVPGTIVASTFQGNGVEYDVDIGGAMLRVFSPGQPQLAPGASVWIGVPASGNSVFKRKAG